MGVDVAAACLQWNGITRRFELETLALRDENWAGLSGQVHAERWEEARRLAKAQINGEALEDSLEDARLMCHNAKAALALICGLRVESASSYGLPCEGAWSHAEVKRLWDGYYLKSTKGSWCLDSLRENLGIYPWGYWSAVVFLQTCARHGYAIHFN